MNANCNAVLGQLGLYKGSKMVKSAISILAVTAAAGIALTPVAASAATAGPAALAVSSSPMQAGPGLPEDTTVTFTVTTGTLTITAPATIPLGSGAPGTTISGPVGPVTVTDNRALLTAAWTATASATAWTTGGGTLAETIPVSRVGYAVGSITTTGTITATGTSLPAGVAAGDLSGTAQPVVTGTAGVGDNSATWNPTLSVAVPASAVGGAYTGTLTHSVS
jgi:hypothetical protein